MKPRKIIIATTDIGTGGLGSYLTTLIAGLKSRGWDVHLLVTNTHGEYFEEMRGIVDCHDMSFIPLSPKKVFMASDLVNSMMPDVILSNNCALMQYAIPLIEPRIRIVPVLHSDDSRFYAIASLFSDRVFRWIAPTAGVAARLREFVDRRLHNRIRAIPHGINNRRFFPKAIDRDGSARQILFAGFLGESKGADLLPDIFQKIVSAIPDSFLTIIGAGPLKALLDSAFGKRGLRERVLMQGTTSPDQTAERMRMSDILLLPTNLEGFGMAIVEAMMCGVVPVISRLQGITDQLVEDGETGFLVTPRDVHAFAEGVKRICRDDRLFHSMSLKARKRAYDTFSLEQMLDGYERLFAEPDDRPSIKRKGRSGWYSAAAYQYLRKRWR